MTKLFWHLLTNEQDYAYTLPTPLAKKIRRIELESRAPAPSTSGPARREP